MTQQADGDKRMGEAEAAAAPGWPTGPWWVWVTRDGRLLVSDGQQPEPTAYPVAGAATRHRAFALRQLIGRYRHGFDEVVAPDFCGTIGGAEELKDRLAERIRWHG